MFCGSGFYFTMKSFFQTYFSWHFYSSTNCGCKVNEAFCEQQDSNVACEGRE